MPRAASLPLGLETKVKGSESNLRPFSFTGSRIAQISGLILLC